MAVIEVDVGEGVSFWSPLAAGPPLVPCRVEEEMAVIEVDVGGGYVCLVSCGPWSSSPLVSFGCKECACR